MAFRLFCFAVLATLSIAAGADDAVVLKQFIVHLETGDAWDPSLSPSEQVNFAEHSANMNRLRKEGTILFGARYSEFGLLIIQGQTLEATKEILRADPGVKAGIFDFRVEPISIFYPWKTDSD